MKILHLSHNGLPAMRTEKAAQTGKKKGFSTCFAGPFVKGLGLPVKSFDKFYKLPFNKFANAKIPFHWRTLRKSLHQILREYRPDFVHAHNIVAAKLISEFEVPFIYDDYESLPEKLKIKEKGSKPSRMYVKWLGRKWEKELSYKASAIIVVGKTIAEERRKLSKRVFVVPNFPCRIETRSLKLDFNNDKRLSSVYVGLPDFSRSLIGSCVSYRNVEGVLQFFRNDDVGTLTVIGDPDLPSFRNINSRGFVPHQMMMKELTKHHIGLIPWKKHWFHRYCNPNKPYEYAHAGLLVLSVSDLTCVIHRLGGHYVAFNDFHELKELLLYYADNLDEVDELRPKIRKFALENLTWEKKCEPEILQAYSKI